ncbi:general transcription factor II-I repeat domain-containing protein 2-like [Clavelina lepadiformis]|uniref:general transcription factor II-I repeat domain-containing protein 2-like n=1 Tax=Clavelina lepadiformis TaxID=159417 RepID=UPI004042F6D4
MKPYSDGEIMKQAIVTFATECCSSAIQQKAKKLQLSNTTVTRRIECISNDQHDQLLEKLKNFVYYSFALDSSKDFTDTEQLVVFIRGVMPDFTIYEEYLTLRSLHGTTKGTDIFREFHATLEEAHLDSTKLFGVATDGCPAMIGANQGLQGLINKWREEDHLAPVTWHHCILHQESLVAKSLNMSNVMDVVTTTVNWIRVNALNHRKLKKFLADTDAEYGDLVMFTAVRWLSRATCVKRFYDLLPEIKMFAEGKKDILQLRDEVWIADLAFFVDITTHLSTLNRTLQGNSKFCHNLYSTAIAFVNKLCLWKTQLAGGVTIHFPTLSDHQTNGSFEAYSRLISNLIDEFNHRINGMSLFLPMMNMFANPIAVNVATAPDSFQLELLDMQSDIELKQLFRSEDLLEFWIRVPEGKYPNLKTNAQKYASVFGSTYVCEALFSKMIRIKNKYRNRLTDDHLKQLLHTASSAIAPRFDKLVKAQSQCQVGH